MIAIIGAGGHGKCVFECFYLAGQEVIGFFDDDRDKKGMEVINGLQVLGRPEEIEKHDQVSAVFIAIGDNRRRLDLYARYKEKGYLLPSAVHKLAYQSSFAEVGAGNFLMGPAVINPGSRIGNCCIINTSATVGHDCLLEDGVQIGPGVNLAGGSRLGKGVFVGIGAKVAPQVRIGPWAVVGAGSVVLDDLPGGTFCCGSPARTVEP